MSLRDRLINIAKAELKSAARKVRASAEELIGKGETPPLEDELPREREEPRPRPRKKHQSMSDDAKIQRYYANLELPLGAPLSEVKAAYRRLMRRYHPDLHQEDPKKAEVATRLAQELRTAYEGLIAHLEQRP